MCEFPARLEREDATAREPPRLAPTINVIFRPEEEHCLSREDDIVPPISCRNGKVEKPLAGYSAVRDCNLHGCTAIAATTVDNRVGLEHGGNAQRIPNAVAVRDEA